MTNKADHEARKEGRTDGRGGAPRVIRSEEPETAERPGVRVERRSALLAVAGMPVALGGGSWMGSAAITLTSSPDGGAGSLVVLFVAIALTIIVARLVLWHGGRPALMVYAGLAGVATVGGPWLIM